ncbi:hypothetical protein GOV11_05095 [Candidatus Woesearchaeota archaeon]|nr:hypothetical protein [Candidatus Woesearchaeota archaeon]
MKNNWGSILFWSGVGSILFWSLLRILFFGPVSSNPLSGSADYTVHPLVDGLLYPGSLFLGVVLLIGGLLILLVVNRKNLRKTALHIFVFIMLAFMIYFLIDSGTCESSIHDNPDSCESVTYRWCRDKCFWQYATLIYLDEYFNNSNDYGYKAEDVCNKIEAEYARTECLTFRYRHPY